MQILLLYRFFLSTLYEIDKAKKPSHATAPLKVPKREIFDRSDFPDFYTVKPLRVGDFGVKIKIF